MSKSRLRFTATLICLPTWAVLLAMAFMRASGGPWEGVPPNPLLFAFLQAPFGAAVVLINIDAISRPFESLGRWWGGLPE